MSAAGACIVRRGMEGLLCGREQASLLDSHGLRLRTGSTCAPDMILTFHGRTHFFVCANGCGDAEAALVRVEQVVRVAAYRACNVLLPGACAAVPGVLDAVVRLQLVDSARFLFLAHGEDFVEAALRLVAALDAADEPPAAEVERERLAQVVAWEPTEAALTAIEFGPRPGDAVSAAMAMQLSIFGSLTALAAATSEELADNAGVSPTVAAALHAFWQAT
ncbi:hypothetical protein FOA52_013870 [Chlamydomonas sp. UWO 241]|nr:hypothetical protein FOA52_013870 [Chlamydomonas sp. UWO 241]